MNVGLGSWLPGFHHWLWYSLVKVTLLGWAHLSGWGHTLFVCLFEALIGWSVRKAEVFIHFLCGTFAEVSLREHGTG